MNKKIKRIKGNEKYLRDLQGKLKHISTYKAVPVEKDTKKEAEKIFEDLMAKTSQIWWKNINVYSQEFRQTPSGIKTNRSSPTYIINCPHQMQARRQWDAISKVMEEKVSQPRILYPENIIKNESEIGHSQIYKTWKNSLLVSCPPVLKGVLNTEVKTHQRVKWIHANKLEDK